MSDYLGGNWYQEGTLLGETLEATIALGRAADLANILVENELTSDPKNKIAGTIEQYAPIDGDRTLLTRLRVFYGRQIVPIFPVIGELNFIPDISNIRYSIQVSTRQYEPDSGNGSAAPEFSIVSVTTLEAGETATVTNSGSGNEIKLNFGIPRGDDGDPGDPGAAGTISIGTVTTLEAGQPATVGNSGTDSAAVLNFGIPRGDDGDPGDPGAAGTITIGTVTTLEAGQPATATNSGTDSAAVLNFGIPRGAKGDPGDPASTLLVPITIETAIAPVSLTRNYPGDDRGLLYYLGTNGGSTAWSNPAGNSIQIYSVGTNGILSLVTDRATGGNGVNFSIPSAVIIDLGNNTFKPNRINTFVETNSFAGIVIGTLSVSNNNNSYTPVTSFSFGDSSYGIADWIESEFAPGAIPYRYLKLELNSSATGGAFRRITEIELYGEVTPATVSSINLSPDWIGKLAVNSLYSNNYSIKIPANYSSFPAGSVLNFWNENNCTMTFSGESSAVNLISYGTATIEQSRSCQLIHRGGGYWYFRKF